MRLKTYVCSNEGCTNTFRLWSKKKIDPEKVVCKMTYGRRTNDPESVRRDLRHLSPMAEGSRITIDGDGRFEWHSSTTT